MSRAIRPPRDIDAELRELEQQKQALETRKREQWADLIEETGLCDLPIVTLTGALLEAAGRMNDQRAVDGWQKVAEAAFQNAPATRRGRRPRGEAMDVGDESAADTGAVTPLSGLAA